MIGHHAARHRRTERNRLEIFSRNVRKNQAKFDAKSEAAVIAGLAEHDASGSAALAQAAQSFARELRADAAALILRQDGNRAKSVPIGRTVGNRYRGHRRMADD